MMRSRVCGLQRRIYVTGITLAAYEGIPAQEVFSGDSDPSLQLQSYATWGGAGNDGSTSIATDGKAVYVSGRRRQRVRAAGGVVLKFDGGGSILALLHGAATAMASAMRLRSRTDGLAVGTAQSDAGARLMIADSPEAITPDWKRGQMCPPPRLIFFACGPLHKITPR
jgi:hypothetical protein